MHAKNLRIFLPSLDYKLVFLIRKKATPVEYKTFLPYRAIFNLTAVNAKKGKEGYFLY